MRALLIGLSTAVASWAALAAPPVARAGQTHPTPPVQSLSPRTDAICCCGVQNQTWRYSWMASGACAQAGGSCVSPDHC